MICFITGSARGLGRSITEAALNAGHSVIATARNPAPLKDLAKIHGDRLLAVAMDVTKNDDVLKAVVAGIDAFGRIDVVVNNAGYGDIASVEDVTIENFKAQIDTNLMGVVYVCKAVLPIMRAQGSGHIFQVSSIGGRVGSVGLSAYQSAKWAIGGFSTVLAQEVAPFGIKVTVLEPGGMRTDWAGSSMTIPPISAPYRQTIEPFVAMLKSALGQEASDPAKVAELMLRVAGMQDAPLRLLVGPDAFGYGIKVGEDLAASDARLRELSISTAA